MTQRILSQKSIFSSRYLDCRQTTLQLINQKTLQYYDIYRKPIAGVFPVTEDGFIYLIRQYRYLYDTILTEEVAGHVDGDELPLKAAKRELLEEAGIIADKWEEMTSVYSHASMFQSRVHLFLAKDLKFTKPKREDDEDIEVFKLSIDEAFEKALSGEISTVIPRLGIMLIYKRWKEGKL